MLLLILCFVISTAVTHWCDCLVFTAIPSSIALSGSYLKLSCSSKNQIFPIIWSHDGKDIAENCHFYIENHRYICNRLNDVYEIYIPSVKYEDRGNWSCAHGPKTQKSIYIDVLVKADVYPPKLLTLPTNADASPHQKPSVVETVDSSGLHEKAVIGYISGMGTFNKPIDLTNKRIYAENGIFIECTTSCASSVKGIHWRAQNSTWSHSLHVEQDIITDNDIVFHEIHRIPQKLDHDKSNCQNGLKSVKSRIQIKCDTTTTRSGVHKRTNNLLSHSLIGLNKITCFPYYEKPMEYKLSKINHLNEEMNVYQYNHNKNNWPDVNSQTVCFVDDGNGYLQAAACIYVICPGQPVAWFTFGEKIALATSVALFIVLSSLFCYVTRQRRRAKRKADMSPGQQHEIELML
uniref:Ig-like domain-containing protein n=1 Tax=Trichobilharzia regenti TaxID=157069 RepID=A0AA85JZT3_TRIRE|nr:unnamed protein product [Trichobilharzia regenti]